MSDHMARIPSVSDTVRTYLLRAVFGGRVRWRNPIIEVLVLGGLVLAVPRVDTVDSPALLTMAILCAAQAVSEARREYLFGGPQHLVVAAGVTTAVVIVAMIVPFFAASVAFGPEPGAAPINAFFRLPTEVLMGVFLAVGVLIVILYWIRKPARLRSEAELQALIRAERAARGRPVEA